MWREGEKERGRGEGTGMFETPAVTISGAARRVSCVPTIASTPISAHSKPLTTTGRQEIASADPERDGREVVVERRTAERKREERERRSRQSGRQDGRD
eukprot:148553-Rhodomonas_salina.2